jgi:DNA primase
VRAQGPAAFRALLAAATPLSEYFVGELASRVDVSHADGRAKLVTLARPLLERLPPGVYRELLIRELSDCIGIEAARLAALLEQGAPGQRPRPSAARPPAQAAPAPTSVAPSSHAPSSGADGKPTRVRAAIRLVLHYPGAVRAVGTVEGLAEVDLPGAALLRQLLEIAENNPDIQTAHLLERFRGQAAERHLVRLAGQPPLDEEPDVPGVLREALERIVRDHEHQRAAEAIRNSRQDLN